MTAATNTTKANEAKVDTATIPVPDDWHVHLRDDEMLAAVVDHTARWFRYALVMPNLSPPVTTLDEAQQYRDRITQAVSGEAPNFYPLMSLYLTAQLTPDHVAEAARSGQIAGIKFYPAGATTNSDAGGTSLLAFAPVLEAMAETGTPLLVHAESTDPALDIFDREAAFLVDEVAPVLESLPELSVTVEHISTSTGIDLVRSFDQAYGSITPHHLSCDRSDILANGLRPELYCKPVINSAEHKQALIDAATSGDPKFFLGTDSAPHPLSAKEARVAKAGIFNAPYALEVTAEVFYQAGALENLAAFTSINGSHRYGYEPAAEELQLVRQDDQDLRDRAEEPPGMLETASGEKVRLFGTAEAALWTLSRL